MTLSFFGAAGEVTGSCCLVDTGKTKILVDCGMFQGGKGQYDKNLLPFPFAPSEIDAVILTHAHLDHVGRVPKLVHEGFTGRIFATHPTRLFARLMWEDAARVMKQDARQYHRAVVYHEEQVPPAFDQTHGMEYDADVNIAEGVIARFREAGHIFGSSFVELEVDGQTLTFSGDLGNDNVPILRDTAALGNSDVLIMESTYGNRGHEPTSERVPFLQKAIQDTVAQKGTLLIPAFSIERAQEILYELNGLSQSKQIPLLPIFLDSPLAMHALEVYKRFPKYYDHDAQVLRQAGDDFFTFPGLTIVEDTEGSRELRAKPGPKVIVAGSGMMHGGRVMKHLAEHLSDPTTIVLVVGYQGVGTTGRTIADGAKTVTIDHEQIEINADIRTSGSYSAHADKDKLVRWAMSAKVAPKKIVLVHGDPEAAEALEKALKEKLSGTEVVIPKFGEQVIC